MDRVQVHPSGFIDPAHPSTPSKILAPEALRGSGGILLNEKGQRFANELGPRDYLSQKIRNSCEPHETILDSGKAQHTAYLVLNQDAVNAFGPDAIKFYMTKSLFRMYANTDVFCEDKGK